MGREGHGSDGTGTTRNARTVWAVLAGGSLSGSHFDALQRRHVRRAWSTAAYFKSSRVCRHVILPKELQTLPWGLESTARCRWHPLGACAGGRSPISFSTPFVQGQKPGVLPSKTFGADSRIKGTIGNPQTPAFCPNPLRLQRCPNAVVGCATARCLPAGGCSRFLVFQ
jgi:hypothetical protein